MYNDVPLMEGPEDFLDVGLEGIVQLNEFREDLNSVFEFCF